MCVCVCVCVCMPSECHHALHTLESLVCGGGVVVVGSVCVCVCVRERECVCVCVCVCELVS